MGKASTYRRRGTSTPPAVLLPAPGKPLLYLTEDEVFQEATTGDDTGGQCELWRSIEGLDPWLIMDTLPWSALKSWGFAGDYGYGYFRCREVGNGSTYQGDSPWSDTIEIASP